MERRKDFFESDVFHFIFNKRLSLDQTLFSVVMKSIEILDRVKTANLHGKQCDHAEVVVGPRNCLQTVF